MKISPRKWSSRAVEEFVKQVQTTGVMPRYSPFHNGDTTLRAADLNYSYTEDEVAERVKIASNIFYFAENFCTVMQDEGTVKIKHLRKYQKKSLTSFTKHLRTVWLASRQIGKSVSKFTILYLQDKDGNDMPLPVFELYYHYAPKSLYNRFLLWLYRQQYSLHLRIEESEALPE